MICFLLAQLLELVHCYDVTLLVNTDHPDFLASRGVHIRVIMLRIERKIRPWRDIRALFAMIRLFRREHFDLVQSLMPKAGLLAMLASLLGGDAGISIGGIKGKGIDESFNLRNPANQG